MSKTSDHRQDFLKTFFVGVEQYAYKEVNGFILVNYWNGDAKDWRVAVYTKESYKRQQDNAQRYADEQGRLNRYTDLHYCHLYATLLI